MSDNTRKSITFFISYMEAMDDLKEKGLVTDADVAKWYEAITHYAFYGVEPEHKGVLRALWCAMFPTLSSIVFI